MKGFLFLIVAMVASVMPSIASAQISQIDGAFSDELISELGYPLIEVNVGPDGVEAPSELAPGFYHFRLTAADGFIGYMNVVQPPAGLSRQEEEQQMLAAGAMDLPQEGWTYLGGTNTPGAGEPASFVIELREGEYKIAASYYAEDESVEEVMRLVPLTVRADASPIASPVASVTAPEESVALQFTDDLQYIVTPETVAAGPQIWKFENTGTERSHHIVIFRVPDGTTSDDIIGEFSGLMMGTPPAEDGLMMQLVWSGYGAMQSGGTVTWTEFDFQPGTYAVICFIMDDEQSMPHVMDGMVTTFDVED
jgi:hypothetical protein